MILKIEEKRREEQRGKLPETKIRSGCDCSQPEQLIYCIT
jgi:hypothetical protein